MSGIASDEERNNQNILLLNKMIASVVLSVRLSPIL